MSHVDIADYYAFKVTKNGNHTLRLTNLPANTEWAAMIWIDKAQPAYAPGNTDDGSAASPKQGMATNKLAAT